MLGFAVLVAARKEFTAQLLALKGKQEPAEGSAPRLRRRSVARTREELVAEAERLAAQVRRQRRGDFDGNLHRRYGGGDYRAWGNAG